MDVNSSPRYKAAIDLMITMVVDEVAQKLDLDPSDVLPQFLESRTGKMLLDESTKMWWEGPSGIVEEYLKEKQAK